MIPTHDKEGADTVAELGPRAFAATSGQAAAAGDIVVVTVPVKECGVVAVVIVGVAPGGRAARRAVSDR